jgi:hypothetical protein
MLAACGSGDQADSQPVCTPAPGAGDQTSDGDTASSDGGEFSLALARREAPGVVGYLEFIRTSSRSSIPRTSAMTPIFRPTATGRSPS